MSGAPKIGPKARPLCAPPGLPAASRPNPSTPPSGPEPTRGWTPEVRPGGWQAGRRIDPARARPAPPTETVGGVGLSIDDPRSQVRAAAELRRTVGALTQSPELQEKLQKQHVAIVLIPANKKMTDLPEFASLKGQRTFDGRSWDDVRGIGGVRLRDGTLAVGVAEETLLHSPPDTYPPGYNVAMHELGHVIQDYGVDDKTRRQIGSAYENRKNANGPWTETYGASNPREYFAQATNAYFSENDGVGKNGAQWLFANDPPMYAILVRVYGPPPPG